MTEIIRENFDLSAEKIDEISAVIAEALEKFRYDKKDALRIRLLTEELLLAVLGSSETRRNCGLSVRKRFGSCEFSLSYDGLPFSPLEAENDEYRRTLLENLGVGCRWSYANEKNTLSFTVKKRVRSSAVELLAAVLAAVLIGLIRRRLPPGFASGLEGYVLTPVRNAYLRILNGLAGVLIFFNIMTSLCGDRDSELLRDKSRRLLTRLPLMALLFSAASYLLLLPVSKVAFTFAGASAESQAGAVMDLLWDIVPFNVVTPFAEGNLLQILILALAFGAALSSVQSRFPELIGTVAGINHVIMTVAVRVCRFCPVFVFCSLTAIFLSRGVGTALSDLWKPVVMLLGVSLVLISVTYAVLAVKYRCNPFRFLKITAPAVMICTATGSSVAAYSTNAEILEKQLGVSKRFSRLGLSIGSKIYGPGLLFYLAVMVVFFAEKYQVPVTPGMLLTAIFLTVILVFVCPPVPGGLLVIFGILAKQFGLPEECLTILAAADIILDGPATGISCILRNAELLFEADRYGEWNRHVFEKL